MHSTRQAVEAATEAVRLWEELGDDGNVATALVTLARQQWVTDQPVAARESAERALRLVEAEGDTERHAVARLNLGAVLVLTDREDEGLPVLAAALEVADRAGALEPAALCHNYIGRDACSSVTCRGRLSCCAACSWPGRWITTSTSCADTAT